MSDHSVAVVGSGPAGLAAAITAAGYGLAVTVYDERAHPGGRLRFDQPGRGRLGALVNECERLGVTIQCGSIVWGIFPGWTLSIETAGGPTVVDAGQVVLATGSTDRSLTFEGSTRPGVMTGSGLRRLIGEYGVLPGRRVLILGDGPDAAMTAHAVREAGGQVIGLLDETAARSIVVEGVSGVESVTVDGRKQPVDIVAIAVGRQPDVQLAAMAGIELIWNPDLGGWAAPTGLDAVDSSGPIVAGDAAGVDTIDICELDGALAGTIVAARLGAASRADVEAAAAAIASVRPSRLGGQEPVEIYRQPWQVPLEVME